MKTSHPTPQAPLWHLVDATGLRIGTLSSKVAHVLRGKHRPSFTPHQLCGDHVVIINIAKLDIPQAKGQRKIYYHHTGYPGSMQRVSLEKMFESHPEKVIEKAVKGMLPANRLRPQMLKRLHLFADAEHPYAPQQPAPLDISTL